MSKILDGIKFGFGFILVLGFIFTLVLASGWHTADEILEGTFSGNFIFEDNVTFNGNVTGISSGDGVPVGGIITFTDSCPVGYTLIGDLNSIEINPTQVYVSSTYSGYDKSALIDDDIGVFWTSDESGAATPQGWIAFEFGNSNIVNNLRVYPNSNEHLLIDDFSVYGSSDSTNGVDGTWNLIVSNLDTLEGANVWSELAFSNSNSYTWYKFVGNHLLHSGSAYYIQIAEVEFYSGNVMCKKN